MKMFNINAITGEESQRKDGMIDPYILKARWVRRESNYEVKTDRDECKEKHNNKTSTNRIWRLIANIKINLRIRENWFGCSTILLFRAAVSIVRIIMVLYNQLKRNPKKKNNANHYILNGTPDTILIYFWSQNDIVSIDLRPCCLQM